MKKIIATSVITACIFALCGCATPLKPVEVSPNADKGRQISVYVSGAVERDGYLTVKEGSDYYALLTKAGLSEYSAPIDYSSTLLDGNVTSVIVNYRLYGRTFYSVNVNGAVVIYRLRTENVSDHIINKLADYIQLNGTISNREKLRDALGEDYDDNFYKFYIDVQDYA